MKTLIIYAHPLTKGHCPTILEEIKSNLSSKNIDYEVIDLYKIKYNPILEDEEHYTAGNRKVSKQNLKFQDKIKESDKLIFIYPVWWNSTPAILKGFIDRVFTPHFAFKWEGKVPKPLLKGKKAIIFLTTGASKLFFKIFEGNRAIKIIKKDILKFCGIKSKVFHLGSANNLNDNNINKIKSLVNKGLAYLY